MTWNAWMGVLHWAAFGIGCALGAFSLLALNTNLMNARWQRHPGGIRAGRLMAKAGCLMAALLIAMTSTSLFDFPHWLGLALIALQLVCLGGYVWLMLVAHRIRPEKASR
ncbi:hypothetical protein AB0H88_38005 [Nonomuraea sp. NPDC050680]|uniref:hypothetical protein n=1 Tax=Nonomuraea sp. NPDC050680 TaxID=3154630 RepID=UPI0034062921